MIMLLMRVKHAKRSFITLSLLCLCFALVIVLHSWGLQREINMLISSMLLTWALLICVDHRAFFRPASPDHRYFDHAATV